MNQIIVIINYSSLNKDHKRKLRKLRKLKKLNFFSYLIVKE